MKFFVVAGIAAYFSLSAAQLEGLPDCANACALNSIPKECGLDPTCICGSKSFLEGISCCVSKSCDQAGQDASLKFAQNICEPAGVSDLPTQATCASGGETSSSDAAASETGIASGAETTSTTTGSSMSGNAEASSAESSASSEEQSASNGESSPTSSSGAATGESTNSSNNLMVQSMGVMAIAVLGAVALM